MTWWSSCQKTVKILSARKPRCIFKSSICCHTSLHTRRRVVRTTFSWTLTTSAVSQPPDYAMVLHESFLLVLNSAAVDSPIRPRWYMAMAAFMMLLLLIFFTSETCIHQVEYICHSRKGCSLAQVNIKTLHTLGRLGSTSLWLLSSYSGKASRIVCHGWVKC